MKFRCNSCHSWNTALSTYRKGVIQTVLEIFCKECGAKVQASLMYNSEGIKLDD